MLCRQEKRAWKLQIGEAGAKIGLPSIAAPVFAIAPHCAWPKAWGILGETRQPGEPQPREAAQHGDIALQATIGRPDEHAPDQAGPSFAQGCFWLLDTRRAAAGITAQVCCRGRTNVSITKYLTSRIRQTIDAKTGVTLARLSHNGNTRRPARDIGHQHGLTHAATHASLMQSKV